MEQLLLHVNASLIKRYAKEAVLTFDSDEAGIKAALRAIPYLRESGLAIKVLNMKPYKDPDEFIKNMGREAYEERIKTATNFFIFQVDNERKNYDLNDPQEKTAFHNKVAEMLLVFKDELERENYIDSVCQTFNISKDGLSRLVKKKALNYVGKEETVQERQQVENKKSTKEDAAIKTQRILLAYLIDRDNWFKKLLRYFTGGFY